MLTGGDEEKKKKNTEVVASSKLEKDTQVKKIDITKKSDSEKVAENIKEIEK